MTQISANFEADFVSSDGLLENLQIQTEGKTPEELLVAIVNLLNTFASKLCLLVVDNADVSLEIQQSYLPKSDVGTQCSWHILVTSRQEIPGFTPKELGFLSPKQTYQLFTHYYKRSALSDEEIEALVKSVDYHTLVIEILAKTAQDLRVPYQRLKAALQGDIRGKVSVELDDYATIETLMQPGLSEYNDQFNETLSDLKQRG